MVVTSMRMHVSRAEVKGRGFSPHNGITLIARSGYVKGAEFVSESLRENNVLQESASVETSSLDLHSLCQPDHW